MKAQALPAALVTALVSAPQLAAGLSLGREAQELGCCRAVVAVELASVAESRLTVETQTELVVRLVLVEADVVKFPEVVLH